MEETPVFRQGCEERATVRLFRSRRTTEQRGRAAGTEPKKKKDRWLNKDCYFPQCSKPTDHDSIPCTVLWLCGLGVSRDYLLWIPNLALKLNHSPTYRNTYKQKSFPETNSFRNGSQHSPPLLAFLQKLQRLLKDMFVFFHFIEGWIQLSAIRNGLPIH